MIEKRPDLWRLGSLRLVLIILEKLLELVRVINNSDSIRGVVAEECHNSRIPLNVIPRQIRLVEDGEAGSIDLLVVIDINTPGINPSKIGRSWFTPPGSALTYFLETLFASYKLCHLV